MALLVRPARPDDRAAVFAITALIWEGHDYLPEVWEPWLHDPAGPMLLGVLDGHPVAVSKITLQTPSEAWLSGMRVDPAYRGRGIATELTEALLAWLAVRHVPIARFSTATDNTPIQRLAALLRFQAVAEVDPKGRSLEEGPSAPSPRMLTPDEELVAWTMFSASSALRVTRGLYGLSWTWTHFSRARLREHLVGGEVLGWGKRPDALGIVVHRSSHVPRYVALLAGEREAGLLLLRALLRVPRLAVDDPLDPPQLRLAVPTGSEDIAWIAGQAGLQPGGHVMRLFQRDAREVQR